MDDPGAPNILKKIFRSLKHNDSVTEEEILSMLDDVSNESGGLPDDQREMITNIFEFDDANVSELMTHRTDIAAAKTNDNICALRDLAIEEGYSRIPVYEDDLDNIVGIAYIKDVLKFVGTDVPSNLTVGDIMRKATYVPKTMSCTNLFKNMTESHIQMAIVVDEYGGTAGLITMEDLLEAIVGNIQDEYDDEEEEIQKIDENVFTVDGTTDIDEIEDLLDTEIPEGEYDTLGGFIISMLGYIPDDGSQVELEYDNLHMTVLDIEDRRIGKVKIVKVEE